MANYKATKAALVGSVISLALSFSMLLGTTFAWFTDSVSSSNNRILTGNLDIDLLMYKSGEYVSIAEGSGDIFAEANGNEAVHWEPGRTETVYLAVENIGSLALKYDINLFISGELSGALEYEIFDGKRAGEPATTEEISIQKGKLDAKKIIPIINGALNKQDDKNYFAVTVNMPYGTLDSYQGKSITVDLTLAATQSPYEKDSFGEDYDELIESESDKHSITTVTIGTTEEFIEFADAVTSNSTYKGINVANNPDVCVTLTSDLDLSDCHDFLGIGDGENNSFDGVFDGCDHTIENWIADNQDTPLALFRSTNNADIKNLTISNFGLGTDTAKGSDSGILIGSIGGGDVVIDKVNIKKSTITAQGAIGVIVGTMTEGYLTVTNCNIEEIIIKSADGYANAIGVLLGSGYSDNDYDESGFEESENTISNVTWFNAEEEQSSIPSYNYTK